MKKDFEEEAENWAKKVLKEENIENITEELKEFIMFGRVGYRIDEKGIKSKLTQEELGKIIQEGDSFVRTQLLSKEEVIEKYKGLLTDKDKKNLEL